MNTLRSFQDFQVRLLGLRREIDEAIAEFPRDSEVMPHISGHLHELLGTTATAMQDTLDCVGVMIQDMRDREEALST